MTGWNMPPGVNVSDIPGCGPDQPCEICGGYPDSVKDPCICPECEVCLSIGDHKCYEKHNLLLTEEQKFLRAWQDALEIEKYGGEMLPD